MTFSYEYENIDWDKLDKFNDHVNGLFPNITTSSIFKIDTIEEVAGALSEVILTTDFVVLKNKKSCYCYDELSREDIYYMRFKKQTPVTVRMILELLNQEKYTPECRHISIEGFTVVVDHGVDIEYGC